jgi:fructokinase
MTYRIGIDLGGTKIEIATLRGNEIVHRSRVPTPHDYHECLRAIADLVRRAEAELGASASVGIGIPGAISPATGLVKNANSNALNGHRFDADLAGLLGREIRVTNDANCFALSEAVDGAAAGARLVFGVIIGTGCGGGIVIDGRALEGRHRIAGEWGHTPLPWPRPDEMPLRACWCGHVGCLETYLSGPALAREADGPGAHDATSLPARAKAGEARAMAALHIHADRLARGLAMIVNVLDPDAIVLGGGLSNMDHLYRVVPDLMRQYTFSDVMDTPVLRNKHGDSSGVRGAAWLWPA